MHSVSTTILVIPEVLGSSLTQVPFSGGITQRPAEAECARKRKPRDVSVLYKFLQRKYVFISISFAFDELIILEVPIISSWLR